ncbi:MAG: glutamate 5-kinase [Clostridiaceae bacterium]|nr:glutamate 5-kinase [Clostridiaceae bacterium]
MSSFINAKRIVVKVGSSSLTYDNGMVNIRQIEKLCKILSDIKNSGREIILVTSGAIAVGASKLGLSHRPETIPEKQAAAAAGQCELMYIYDKHFLEYHHKVAQILLTRDIIENDERCSNAVNTLEALLTFNTIPIVNENDTVAVEEIRFGDNDTLSALVASLVKAEGLIILSDIDGLFEENPHDNPNAPIIPLVTEIDDHIEAIAGGAGSDRGTGGMATKIAAAKICFESGCSMAIINSNRLEGLYDVLEGNNIGTLFEKR